MLEKAKAEEATSKEAQIHAEMEHIKLTKKLIELEKEAEKKLKILEKETLDQYSMENKKYKNDRAKRQAEYNVNIELCNKQKQVINAKIKSTLGEVQKRSKQLPWFNKVYDNIKKRKEDKQKQVEDHENKNIKLGENRASMDEQKSKEKNKQNYDKNRMIAKSNKEMFEYEKEYRCPHLRKCYCDRQSLLLNNNRKKSAVKRTPSPEKRSVSFAPSNKLQIDLQNRIKEPSGWSGGKTKDEQFTKEANQVLKEVKYKNPVRKVMEEYKLNNGLQTLEIAK